MGPEETKLKKWHDNQKADGLVDIKFTFSKDAIGKSREELCKDINQTIENIENGKNYPIDWAELDGIIDGAKDEK